MGARLILFILSLLPLADVVLSGVALSGAVAEPRVTVSTFATADGD